MSGCQSHAAKHTAMSTRHSMTDRWPKGLLNIPSVCITESNLRQSWLPNAAPRVARFVSSQCWPSAGTPSDATRTLATRYSVFACGCDSPHTQTEYREGSLSCALSPHDHCDHAGNVIAQTVCIVSWLTHSCSGRIGCSALQSPSILRRQHSYGRIHH